MEIWHIYRYGGTSLLMLTDGRDANSVGQFAQEWVLVGQIGDTAEAVSELATSADNVFLAVQSRGFCTLSDREVWPRWCQAI